MKNVQAASQAVPDAWSQRVQEDLEGEWTLALQPILERVFTHRNIPCRVHASFGSLQEAIQGGILFTKSSGWGRNWLGFLCRDAPLGPSDYMTLTRRVSHLSWLPCVTSVRATCTQILGPGDDVLDTDHFLAAGNDAFGVLERFIGLDSLDGFSSLPNLTRLAHARRVDAHSGQGHHVADHI